MKTYWILNGNAENRSALRFEAACNCESFSHKPGFEFRQGNQRFGTLYAHKKRPNADNLRKDELKQNRGSVPFGEAVNHKTARPLNSTSIHPLISNCGVPTAPVGLVVRATTMRTDSPGGALPMGPKIREFKSFDRHRKRF